MDDEHCTPLISQTSTERARFRTAVRLTPVLRAASMPALFRRPAVLRSDVYAADTKPGHAPARRGHRITFSVHPSCFAGRDRLLHFPFNIEFVRVSLPGPSPLRSASECLHAGVIQETAPDYGRGPSVRQAQLAPDRNYRTTTLSQRKNSRTRRRRTSSRKHAATRRCRGLVFRAIIVPSFPPTPNPTSDRYEGRRPHGFRATDRE